MDVEIIKDYVRRILFEKNSLQMYLVLKNDTDFSVRLADIEDSTEPEIREMFSNRITESIIGNDDLSICNLSFADDRNNALFLYDYKEFPDELSLVNTFSIKEAIKVPKFNFDDDDLTSLYGYLIYIGDMEDGVVLFKKHYPISLIKRDSFLLGVKKAKKRFEKISGEEIIRFNGDFQIIRIDDNLYINDIKMLEKSMGFNKLIIKEAESTIELIESCNLLEEIQVLRDSIEDITFARKLSKIKKEAPVFSDRVPNSTIIEFTKTNPGLKNVFKYSDDGKQIRLDTKKSKEAFVKLLNDVFLRSELTKEYYEAKAKDNIPNT